MDKIIQIVVGEMSDENTVIYGLSESGNLYYNQAAEGNAWIFLSESPEE